MSALALNTVYSARDTAITQRPTSTALLCIDSEDRFKDYPTARASLGVGPNASPYNFTINKSESLMNGFFTRVSVTEVVFPWVIPNINQHTSIIGVAYTVGGVGGVGAVDMAHGFYTPSQIASEIQRQIRLIPGLGAFTMTYGIDSISFPAMPPTQRPIFEYKTNAAGVTIGFGTVPTTNPLRKQLFDLLGFNDDNQDESAQANGDDTYCQTTRYIDIVCTQLTANQSLKDTMSQTVARDVLCRVYVGDAQGVQSTILPSSSTFCPPGCMPTTIYRDFAQPKQIQWIPNQPVPGYLKFQVFDDAGFELSDYVFEARGNGANWSMTLLVTEN